MDNKYKFIRAIIEIVCAVILLGISVYYLIVDNMSAFALFMVVGIICIALPVRTILKLRKQDKDGKDKK